MIARAEHDGFVPRWRGLRLAVADASTIRFGLPASHVKRAATPNCPRPARQSRPCPHRAQAALPVLLATAKNLGRRSDAKTSWLLRDRLAQAGASNQVFEQVQQLLLAQGYLAHCGQIVDASLVHAPVQRNKRGEADTVKEGTMPLGWKPHKRA